MNDQRIPLSFVQARRKLTWREVEVGIREGWLAPEDAVLLAVAQVERGDEDPDVLQLASVFKDQADEAGDVVSILVGRKPGNTEEEARSTWMRILLAWVYENRSRFTDPLGIVEEVYADFGYPDEIRHLVRYNPADEQAVPNERGEPGLIRLWSEYVEQKLPPRTT